MNDSSIQKKKGYKSSNFKKQASRSQGTYFKQNKKQLT